MVSIYTISGSLADEKRRKIVFQGGVILFKNVPEILDLVPHVHRLAEEAFVSDSPLTAHESQPREKYLEKVEAFQKSVTHSAVIKDGFYSALQGLGVDLDQTGFSRFTMRVQPPSDSHIDRNTAALGPHRDSWYSQDYAQTNWWTPWYPLESGRCLRIFPRHWMDPMPNSSKGWSLDEFREARAKVTAEGGDFEEILEAYPPVTPRGELRDRDALEILFEPGDILNFSLAHLHQGPPNSTPVTRFSTDFRTMHASDVARGVGAPNIDSESTGSGLTDFNRLSDGRSLDELVEELSRKPVGAI